MPLLDIVFDLLVTTIPQTTGRVVVYVFTLGQVHCEDRAAEVIGFLFWLLVFIAVTVLILKF
jgi:hypothetical protein